MSQIAVPVPQADEYAPFYAGYVGRVAGSDLAATLSRQVPRFQSVMGSLSDSEAMSRYAPGKWSIKEVVGHLSDAERVFAYRVLRLSRGDTTPLPGFDEDLYVESAGFDRRTMDDLMQEWSKVRSATLALVDSIDSGAWERRLVASGSEVSLRALVYVIAGHVDHHEQVLRERYGLDFQQE